MTPLRIDFVSDIACPWCAVGLHGLLQAIRQIDVPVALNCQPFELNPDLGPEGRDIVEYLGEKYGATPDSIARTHALLAERGAAVGFTFGPRTRTWNTFDAHRLLHWAALHDRQVALKKALLDACHGRGQSPADPAVLRACAESAGLDGEAAAEVIASGRYADEVRAAELHWQRLGIRAVPSVVVNRQHLIQGGQPPAAYVQALRQIAAPVSAVQG